MKTVPHQKTVEVVKEPCDNTCKEHYYSKINLIAMSEAALNLDAGAFKLWIYFAKNQNEYEFALSSKAVEETFGMKIKQYNNAVATLIDKGYLVNTKGNNHKFYEKPVITKEDNVVITFEDNELLPEETRNITDTTINNITEEKSIPVVEEEKEPEVKPEGKVSKAFLDSMGCRYTLISKNLIKVIDTGKVMELVG